MVIGHEELDDIPMVSFYVVIAGVTNDAKKWTKKYKVDTSNDGVIYANPSAARNVK